MLTQWKLHTCLGSPHMQALHFPSGWDKVKCIRARGVTFQCPHSLELYQWSCSSLDVAKNRYYLPDLELTDGNIASNLSRYYATSDPALVFMFPLPPVNCSGTVSAIRYILIELRNLEMEQFVFTLLYLEQNGLNFTITDVINVFSTPNEQICTLSDILVCCDNLSLNVMHQFFFPLSNFAFGITRTNFMFALSVDLGSLVESTTDLLWQNSLQLR